MPIRRAVTIILLLLPPAGLSADTSLPQIAINRLKYADLVIHGTITSYSKERVPRSDLFTSDTRGGVSPLKISVIRLEIQDVLKGFWEDTEIEVVLPGAHLHDGGGFIGFSYDHEVGDEVIFGLWYWIYMKGGSFLVGSDVSTLRKGNNGWDLISSREIESIPLDDVRVVGQIASPRNVFSNADVAVIGVVSAIDTLDPENGAQLAYVDLKVQTVLKGNIENSKIRFRNVIRGGIELDWFTPTPKPKEGEQWVILLKEDKSGYYPYAGTNGMYLVRDEQLEQDYISRFRSADKSLSPANGTIDDILETVPIRPTPVDRLPAPLLTRFAPNCILYLDGSLVEPVERDGVSGYVVVAVERTVTVNGVIITTFPEVTELSIIAKPLTPVEDPVEDAFRQLRNKSQFNSASGTFVVNDKVYIHGDSFKFLPDGGEDSLQFWLVHEHLRYRSKSGVSTVIPAERPTPGRETCLRIDFDYVMSRLKPGTLVILGDDYSRVFPLSERERVEHALELMRSGKIKTDGIKLVDVGGITWMGTVVTDFTRAAWNSEAHAPILKRSRFPTKNDN